MERLAWILSLENTFLVGRKEGRKGPTYQPISEEAEALLIEEIMLLKSLQNNKGKANTDYKLSLVDKLFTEGHAGHYWTILAKERKLLGKRGRD